MARQKDWDWLNEQENPNKYREPQPGSLDDWMPVIIMLAIYAFIFFYPWTT